MEEKTKWWQWMLIPFIWVFNASVDLTMYLLYFQCRVLKAPLTKKMLDDHRNWTKDNDHSTEARQKDIFALTIVWVLIHTWAWLPWYWLLIVLGLYVLAFIAILIYVIPKHSGRIDD